MANPFSCTLTRGLQLGLYHLSDSYTTPLSYFSTFRTKLETRAIDWALRLQSKLVLKVLLNQFFKEEMGEISLITMAFPLSI